MWKYQAEGMKRVEKEVEGENKGKRRTGRKTGKEGCKEDRGNLSERQILEKNKNEMEGRIGGE